MQRSSRSAMAGGLLCAALGVLLLLLGGWPVVLGYDLLFPFRRAPAPDEIIIIYMDDDSFRHFGQISTPNWDRNLHANLMDRLTADGSKLVVFDVIFSEPGTPQANSNLVRAIKENGRVVLAAGFDEPSRAQVAVKQSFMPLPEFEDAAAGVGFAEVDLSAGPGRVARQYYIGAETEPGLALAAARVAGAKGVPGWLNYYGPALTVPHISYAMVSNQTAGFFRDKFVFVGARPTTLKAHDEADQFRTPYSVWRGESTPGVELGATAFLNLIRNDAFKRTGRSVEFLLVLVAGAIFGSVSAFLRPAAAGITAVVAIIAMFLIALTIAGRHVWFPWTVIALGQIPFAVAWSVRGHFHRLRFEKEVLERTLQREAARAPSQAGVVIPDHELVRRVGKGAYGEVWLARNIIGAFHAVKVIQRREFASDTPYEREFRGIQRFMPISRSHPGFVAILHAGRNDQEGFFFYIMEACDDVDSGQKINPENYTPKTLALLLSRQRSFDPEECLRLGLDLSLALEHLHQQGLVHRDIKPGNIIYVNGAPKLADIGLVTDIGSGKDVSLIGTEGYIPPEGPGSAAADIYALGKVLYEASMGRDRQMFPEVPTAVFERPAEDLLRRLNAVIFKACATDLAERYKSAAEMHRDLLALRG